MVNNLAAGIASKKLEFTIDLMYCFHAWLRILEWLPTKTRELFIKGWDVGEKQVYAFIFKGTSVKWMQEVSAKLSLLIPLSLLITAPNFSLFIIINKTDAN